MHSVFRRQHLPLYAGLALGAAAAYFATRPRAALRADAPSALVPDTFVDLPLRSAKQLSSNTKELVFDLPEDHKLGGETAFMVLFKHIGEDGKPIIRPYTPISPPDTIGSATFVIKKYDQGKMSTYLHSLKEGDGITVKGPIQKYKLERNQHKQIALLGGGTGITPLYQILQKIATDPKDQTKVHLYYANNSPEDVLIKNEIDALVAQKPQQLAVTYFAAKADDSWKGEKGFITKDYLQSNLFTPKEDNVKLFVCGPPGFYEALSGNKTSPSDQGELTGALKDLGFEKDQVFKF